MPRLYVLGGNGWVPAPRRSTNAYLIETRRAAILLDCGAGVSRLADPMLQAVLRRVSRVIVLLSHYHHDHIEGLSWLPYFCGDHEVCVAGPGASIAGVDPGEVLARFGGPSLLPHPIATWGSRFPKGFSIVSLVPGKNRVLGETVDVVAQPHSDPSAGLRVREVAYVTDTTARPATSEFVRKAAVLIHDAWLDADDEAAGHPDQATHSTAQGAARVAAAADVGELILGHLNPRYDEARLDRMLIAAAGVFPRVRLATDFQVVDIHAADADEPGAPSPTPAAVDAAADDADS